MKGRDRIMYSQQRSWVIRLAKVVSVWAVGTMALPGAGLSGHHAASLAPTVAEAAPVGIVRGRVRLMNRRGTARARAVSAEDVVVFFTPKEPYTDDRGARRGGLSGATVRGETVRRKPPIYEMATKGKTYVPRVLAVPRGTEVAFPNQDKVLHNVFSVSGKNRFDLDLYGPGKSRSHTFDEPGLVRVFCNVHRDMVGFVWVLDTPFFVRPNSEGRFSLEGLPAGPGTLSVWHERARSATYEVTITGGVVEREVELKITRPRLPSHARKDGSAYRRKRGY